METKKPIVLSLLTQAIEKHLRGDFNSAESLYRKIIKKGNNAGAWCNLGVLLISTNRMEEGILAIRRAIECDRSFALAYDVLGTAYSEEGFISDAAEMFLAAMKINPDDPKFFSHAISAMSFFRKPDAVFETASAYGERLGRMDRHLSFADRSRDPNKKLRLGYVASELRAGALAPYLEPVFRHHDKNEFSVNVYCNTYQPDGSSYRIRPQCDTWTYVHAMNAEQISHKITNDEIDILIDVMGHFEHNLLPVFASKPAPIQATYLCQGLTTGLTAVDYAIGDRWLNAGGAMQRFATEKVIELDSGFQVTSFDLEPDIGILPVLRNKHITFGSFNNPAKISDKTLRLWARVLASVPGSKMWIKGRNLNDPFTADKFRARINSFGFDATLEGHIAGEYHMSRHNMIDIMLDTSPFTGGRTTLESLWMGVPVVTLRGDCAYGRYSSANMERMHLDDLIAKTEDEYVNTAMRLAGDRDLLAQYRRDLRDKVKASPLMGHASHTKDLEEKYRTLWRGFCEGAL